MKRLLLKLIILFSPLALVANVGIFSGVGANLKLSKNEDIQMQSEVVRITPLVSEELIDMSSSKRLWADYKCEFILKNLSNKTVKVNVAFPLSGDDRANQGAIKSREFKAISTSFEINDYVTHKVLYVPNDKYNNFSHLFAWDMEFRPNETRKLSVYYKLAGYWGLGSSSKNRKIKSDLDYIEIFTYGLVQSFGYVTQTGSSWAGEIESAEFIFDLKNIENALKEERIFDFTKYPKKEKEEETMLALIKNGQWTRFLDSEFEEQEDGIYVAKFAPFIPYKNFKLSYFLSLFPKDLEGLNEIIRRIELNYNKINERLEKEAKSKQKSFEPRILSDIDKKNLADLILAFYGIEIENETIKNSLENQRYYKSKFHLAIDVALKAKLLEMSNTAENKDEL